jgi:hypothetical protein
MSLDVAPKMTLANVMSSNPSSSSCAPSLSRTAMIIAHSIGVFLADNELQLTDTLNGKLYGFEEP